MAKFENINKDFRECELPKGLVITDPPYNQGYAYNEYRDRMSEEDYIALLAKIPSPCVESFDKQAVWIKLTKEYYGTNEMWDVGQVKYCSRKILGI